MDFLFPVKIVKAEGVSNAEMLLHPKTLQIGLKTIDLAVFTGKSYAILDFGRELQGGARILTFLGGPQKNVRLRFGESVTEVCAELGQKNATNDHSLRDMNVSLSDYSDMTFGCTGFRFLRIDALSEEAQISIGSIVAAAQIDGRAEPGTFTCSDPLVNRIWETAAYTMRLCLQNGYLWDGIKRDRLVWIGDLYPETRASHCLFGDTPEVRNSLDFAREETTLPGWMDNFPSYSLWWIMILHSEYGRSGDAAYLRENIPYLCGLLTQISDCVTPEGDTAYPQNFIDWPTYCENGGSAEDVYDLKAGMHALTQLALRGARELLEAAGEETTLCEDILRRLSRKKFEVNSRKQIAAMRVWAGDKTPKNEKLLLAGGANGFSTFMMYELLSGIAAYGRYGEALSLCKEYYGKMLELGATSFWEDFDMRWAENLCRIDEFPKEGQKDIGDYGAFCYIGYRHSLCHAWSAGVIPYLAETVLGIRAENGSKKITIKPHLSGLAWARGTYPTPYGVVSVEHILQADGSVKTSVQAPAGVEVVVEK